MESKHVYSENNYVFIENNYVLNRGGAENYELG